MKLKDNIADSYNLRPFIIITTTGLRKMEERKLFETEVVENIFNMLFLLSNSNSIIHVNTLWTLTKEVLSSETQLLFQLIT